MCVYEYIYIYLYYIYICTYIFYITHSACWKTLLVSSQFIPEENLSQIFFLFIWTVFSVVINGISCNNWSMPFGEVSFQVEPRNFLHNPDWILRGSLVKEVRNRILNFRIFSQWCFCFPSKLLSLQTVLLWFRWNYWVWEVVPDQRISCGKDVMICHWPD